MSRPSRAGTASVEACLVGALLVLALLAGPLDVPRAFAEALDTLMGRFVTAIGADLP